VDLKFLSIGPSRLTSRIKRGSQKKQLKGRNNRHKKKGLGPLGSFFHIKKATVSGGYRG
jgi:hypothetical protein